MVGFGCSLFFIMIVYSQVCYFIILGLDLGYLGISHGLYADLMLDFMVAGLSYIS